MSTPRILVQLDPDSHPSVFDAVVAIDSNVDHLLQYAGVGVEAVRGLVHGAMFTRSPAELKNTALFIGGSSVSAGEALLKAVRDAFFGPIRCSVMFDGTDRTQQLPPLCYLRRGTCHWPARVRSFSAALAQLAVASRAWWQVKVDMHA